MPDKVTRALLVVLVLLVGYLAFSVHELEQQVDRLPRSATVDHTPVNALNAPLLQIQKNQVSMSAGLHYLELLLEGMVRNDKLPIDDARKAFQARKDGVPPGWNWNAPWETAAPATDK